MMNLNITFKKCGGVLPYKMKKGKVISVYEHGDVRIIFDIRMDGNFNIK